MSLSFYNNPDLEDGFNIWPHPWRTQGHRGLDFVKNTGDAIPSVNAGVVVISEWNKYLGWIVEVRGDDGVYIGYCHMHRQGLPIGTRVEVGAIIGIVGNTGLQSQGAHLHLTKGDRQGAVRGASLSHLSDPWPYIKSAMEQPTPEAEKEKEDEDMPDSMYAVVDGVPSWCWLNWASGKLYAVHSQAEADWVAAYMGSVKMNLAKAIHNGQHVTDGGSGLYKSKLALFGMLAPSPHVVNAGALSDEDLKRIRAQLDAGLAGLTLNVTG